MQSIAVKPLREADIVRLIWNKLDKKIKREITLGQLADFLETHIAGMKFDKMVKHVRISKSLGSDLLLAIERTGLV